MNDHGWFNAFEAGLWFMIAAVLAIRTRTLCAPRRRLGRVAAIAFASFGVTDVIEIFTGAWYRPLARTTGHDENDN